MLLILNFIFPVICYSQLERTKIDTDIRHQRHVTNLGSITNWAYLTEKAFVVPSLSL